VFDALVSAGERLLKAIHALAGSPNKELRSFTDEVSRLAEKMEKYKKD
jgi:hypothetical protein